MHWFFTFIVGSNDGGTTVVTDPEAAKIMDAIGKELNLQPHVKNGVTMAGPTDIEIHLGKV